MPTIGVTYNDDGSVTVVYPAAHTVDKTAMQTVKAGCWEVLKKELNGSHAPRTEKNRRDVVVSLWKANERISYGALITGAMEEMGVDTEDQSARRKFAGLISEMNERGEIRLGGKQ